MATTKSTPAAKKAAVDAATIATAKKNASRKPAAKKAAPKAPVVDHPYGYTVHGHDNCPGCNIHLNNGVGEHMQDVNGKPIKHEKFEYACLGCGHEFGPAIKARKAPTKGMTGKKGTHLNPEAVKSKADAVKAAAAKGRKRPVLAKKPDGSEVLCCSRTAKKNGWVLVERLFSRKAASAPTPAAKRTTRLSKLEDMLK